MNGSSGWAGLDREVLEERYVDNEEYSLPPHFFALMISESCCFFASVGASCLSAMVDEGQEWCHRVLIVWSGACER